jgi:hypothetical protein
MTNRIIIIFYLHLILFSIPVFAQEDNTQNPVTNSETTPEEKKTEEKKPEEENKSNDTTDEEKPKGFSKGKMSIEFKGGQGVNSNVNTALGKARSEIDEILFEYGISDKIGIGFALHHQKYIYESKILEASRLQSIASNLYTLSLLGSGNGLYNYFLLTGLNDAMNQKSTLIIHSTSIDFAGSYHFLTGNSFDPFLRGYAGLGSIGGAGLVSASYLHIAVGGGARYHFTNWLFAIAELNTNIYIGSGGGTGGYSETNGQIGLGVSF